MNEVDLLSILGTVIIPLLEAYMLRAVMKREGKKKTTAYIYLAIFHIPIGALLMTIGGVLMATAATKSIADTRIIEGVWWSINGAIWAAFGFLYIGLALPEIISYYKLLKRNRGARI